jgi:hypothetical protein
MSEISVMESFEIAAFPSSQRALTYLRDHVSEITD